MYACMHVFCRDLSRHMSACLALSALSGLSSLHACFGPCFGPPRMSRVHMRWFVSFIRGRRGGGGGGGVGKYCSSSL